MEQVSECPIQRALPLTLALPISTQPRLQDYFHVEESTKESQLLVLLLNVQRIQESQNKGEISEEGAYYISQG